MIKMCGGHFVMMQVANTLPITPLSYQLGIWSIVEYDIFVCSGLVVCHIHYHPSILFLKTRPEFQVWGGHG